MRALLIRLGWMLSTVLGAVLVLSAAPSAHAAGIYWQNASSCDPYSGACWSTIGHANLDGTGVNQSFITEDTTIPAGLAADGAHIYWSDNRNNRIGRGSLDGTGLDQNFITGSPGHEGDIAVDPAYIYWISDAAVIFRTKLDGIHNPQGLIRPSYDPAGVAVDQRYIYFTNGTCCGTGPGLGTVGRANLDGTGVNEHFIDANGYADGLAVDTTHIYWTNYYSGTIARANLDGTGVDLSFITGAIAPYGIAIDGSQIYWANYGSATIGRANLDGTNVNQSFLNTSIYPTWIAVVVPEPCTGLLVIAGLLGLAGWRRARA